MKGWLPGRIDLLRIGSANPLAAGRQLLSMSLLLLLVAGVCWRVFRFGLGTPLWGDEAAVAVNLLDRTLPESLLEPLNGGQVAPMLFLLMQWLALHSLGTSEWALHLGPMILGTAGLLVFARVSSLFVRPTAAVIATGIVAVGYYSVRHTVELKPYGIDLLVSSCLLGLTSLVLKERDREKCNRPALVSGLECCQQTLVRRPAWWLMAFLPIAFFASFPAVFVAGAAVVAMGVAAARREGTWLIAVTVGAAVCGWFLLLYSISARVQYAEHREVMLYCWAEAFPPVNLAEWPRWLVSIHTGNLFAHPIGAKNGGSILTFSLFVLGIWTERKRLPPQALTLLLVPFVLTFIAACFHRYPYGVSARTSMHLAPIIAIFAGSGVMVVLKWIRPRVCRGMALQRLVCGLLALAAVGMTIDWVKPYKTKGDLLVRQQLQRVARTMPEGKGLAVIQSELALPDTCQWYVRRFFPRVMWQAKDDALITAGAVANFDPQLDVQAGEQRAIMRSRWNVVFDGMVQVVAHEHGPTRLQLLVCQPEKLAVARPRPAK
jgi:hypothetical protein